jgi:dimeric dUTPase (all-alpha-NTP-PPase superfamily)
MMMSSLGNIGFDFFGCLHQIVQFGVFHDLQGISYSTEVDEDLLTVFLQLGKLILCKSQMQKIS